MALALWASTSGEYCFSGRLLVCTYRMEFSFFMVVCSLSFEAADEDVQLVAVVLDGDDLVPGALGEPRQVFLGRGVVGVDLEHLTDLDGIDALSGLEQRLWAVEPHAVERLRGGDVVGHVDSFGPWIPNHYGRYSPSVESKLIGDDPGPGGRPGRRRKVPRRHVSPGAVAAGFAGGGAKSIHSHGYGRAESHEALSDDGPRRRRSCGGRRRLPRPARASRVRGLGRGARRDYPSRPRAGLAGRAAEGGPPHAGADGAAERGDEGRHAEVGGRASAARRGQRQARPGPAPADPVSYTHLRAHETR